MGFAPSESLKRAIKYFIEQGKVDVPIDKMPMYYDKDSGRLFVNVFLASHIQSKNKFKFNREGLYNWIRDFAKKPIVLFKDKDHFEHPLIAGASREVNDRFQATKKVGEIIAPFDKPDDTGTWRGIGEITIDKVKEFLRSLDTDEVPMFSSPQVAYNGPDFDIKHA